MMNIYLSAQLLRIYPPLGSDNIKSPDWASELMEQR